MKPIGLTNKSDGELMIVHLCLSCGKISSNRIAGDDNSHSIICLFETSINLDQKIIPGLSGQGIKLLTQTDKQEVLTSLYGYTYQEP
jgi:hypothetical protein